MYRHLSRSIHQIINDKVEGKPYYRHAQNFKTGFFIGPSIKSRAEDYITKKNQEVLSAQLELAETQIQISKEEIGKHLQESAKAYSRARFTGFARVPASIARISG